jgi:MFS family permease
MMESSDKKKMWMLVVVAALGYFVDVYDLLLFSAIRTTSLADIGVQSMDSLSVGLRLINWQNLGLVIGGLGWGLLGDKRGRLAVLFGSILTYSAANLLNAHVRSVEQYQWLRLFAGIGLAGELGAGITLVAEVMPPKIRGVGTTIIGGFGLLGAALASVIGLEMGWRTAFTVGGVMGLALLVLRFGVSESKLFEQLRHKHVVRGDLFLLFKRPRRLGKFVLCVLIGLPVYFIVGLLITGAPEFGKALGVEPIPKAGVAVMLAYIGMSLGDIVCGLISQLLKSRKKALLSFAILSGITIGVFLFAPGKTLTQFYWKCGFVGFGVGFWALINTNTAEQFGTNLRATVATLCPNLIRASLYPISSGFALLKNGFGLITSATIVGFLCVSVSILATLPLQETFGKDLDGNEV